MKTLRKCHAIGVSGLLLLFGLLKPTAAESKAQEVIVFQKNGASTLDIKPRTSPAKPKPCFPSPQLEELRSRNPIKPGSCFPLPLPAPRLPL
jgi:hypothetical protein